MTNSQTHYLVEWTPWKAVRAAAMAEGWNPDEGTASAADFVEIEDHTIHEEFPTFAAALRRARMVEIHDTWNCPRILRQVLLQNDHDDLGNTVEAMPSFETDAMWEVAEDTDPVEAEPIAVAA
jgi:hypothetical protein